MTFEYRNKMTADTSRLQTMNGTQAVIKSVLDDIDKGHSIDINTRDKILFTAVIDIYEQLDKLGPVILFYKAGIFLASAFGLILIGFLWAVFTHEITISFP